MKSKEKNVKINNNKLSELGNISTQNKQIQLNLINNLSEADKKDKLNFPNIYSNIITSNQKLNNKEKIVNMNMKKINKIYILNNQKNINNKDPNEYYAISKLSRRDFSNRKTTNKILEALSRSSNNNLELSKLNLSKDEKSLFNNLTRNNKSYLKNINTKNLSVINKINIKNYNSNLENQSYFNALSENSSNKNTNITTQRKTLSNRYLKTEANNNIKNMIINTSKEMNIKAFLSNKNTLNKKLDINFQSNSINESLIKLNKINNNNKKEEHNLKTIKIFSRNRDDKLFIENNSSIKKKLMMNCYDSCYLKEEGEFSCPEELHFYYIRTIQRGKNSENHF